jgi:hypothetical protein
MVDGSRVLSRSTANQPAVNKPNLSCHTTPTSMAAHTTVVMEHPKHTALQEYRVTKS